jgi:hypothetical protein
MLLRLREYEELREAKLWRGQIVIESDGDEGSPEVTVEPAAGGWRVVVEYLCDGPRLTRLCRGADEVYYFIMES